jgi:hypothetical protein
VFPQHRFLRFAAVIWLLVAAALLVAMLLRPELQANERKALSVLVPLYFMSFPLGHVGLLAVNRMTLELYLGNEFVPAIYVEGVWLWTLLTVLGYAQWFLLTPLVSSRIRRLGSAYVASQRAARSVEPPAVRRLVGDK